MRAILTGALLLALAGCAQAENEPVSNERDEEAIAEVERMSRPPTLAIAPQQITFQDIEEGNLFGAGCAAMVPGIEEPVFLAQEKFGWLKLDNQIVRLSSDRSSDPLPYETWTKYIGQENWVTLERDSAREKQSGTETMRAPGEIVIYDFADRVVFRASATLECGA